MSDDFPNDDFFKELEEAGNSLMQEFSTTKEKKSVVTNESEKQIHIKTSPNIDPIQESNYGENEIKSKYNANPRFPGYTWQFNEKH